MTDTPPNRPEARQERRWTNDPAIFWVTFAGLLALVAYTFLTYRLVRETKQAVTEAQRATAVVTDTAKRQLRAYLSVIRNEVDCTNCTKKNGKLSPPKSDLPETRMLMTIKNFGLTPAYNLQTCSGATLTDPGGVLPENFSYSCGTNCDHCPKTSIGPNAEHVVSLTLPADQLMMATAGFKRLFYYGQVTFTDAFKSERKLPFCWYYEGGGSDDAIECPDHNSPDDN